ncbi:DNA adenine methylase [Bacillus sp. CD3-1a]|uniref:DNA adenine methylase n=1 Tax=Bacillus sp. CD3-1a TaxID=2587158 RepID=UPI001121ED41|nr:DNA adenine methylase [Bacillus sp. CD3-1a]TNO94765.1 hypothetical protein FH038_20195 [Bacillus sp. CD3-1a]
MITTNMGFPNFVKYMGSKKEILDFIISGINLIHKDGQPICDLFAGSATLSGALRGNNIGVISNDIQEYSYILAETYLTHYEWDTYPDINEIIELIETRVEEVHERFPQFRDAFNYYDNITLKDFVALEEAQRDIVNFDGFSEFDNYYLFTKYYSGTYWNYEQCVWIDSVKYAADTFREIRPLYVAILSSLMFAMAYNSQSTGHYAQYRDAKNEKSMNDILIYRRKNIKDFFVRKFNEIRNSLNTNTNDYVIQANDYKECLNSLGEGTLVYADPPYGLVHYSRFYHILETLVKYDYPNIAHKGRYRDDRHQSPFCISKQVKPAFTQMFTTISEKKLDLVLSYSNSATNTISFADLILLACIKLNNINEEDTIEKIRQIIIPAVEEQLTLRGFEFLDEEDTQVIHITNQDFVAVTDKELIYSVKIKRELHNHSTMGRREDRNRSVNEILIIAERVR